MPKTLEEAFVQLAPEHLKDQLKQGKLSGLRHYLRLTRQSRDWQDRVYILQEVVGSLRQEVLDFTCEAEPEAADLALIRTAFLANLAWVMRGEGTCDEVGKAKFDSASDVVRKLMESFGKAIQLDANDPTVYACALPALRIFGELLPVVQGSAQRALTLAPEFLPIYFEMVKSSAQRWYGSHEASLQIARDAFGRHKPGDDLAACLFQAHLMVRGHYAHFDKNRQAAVDYLRNSEVTEELNQAFDQWTASAYEPQRSSHAYLQCAVEWYFLSGDHERHQRARTLLDAPTHLRLTTEPAPTEAPAVSADELCLQCKEIVANALAVLTKDSDAAEMKLQKALQAARQADEETHPRLVHFVQLHQALLNLRLNCESECRLILQQILPELKADDYAGVLGSLLVPIANCLTQLGERRHAIPFWLAAIHNADEEAVPTETASWLRFLGECYFSIGLRDHAVIPLRAALKILRTYPGNPNLATVLMLLGSSLQKSNPAEAEACMKEFAEIHNSAMRYQSASTAWVNLGLLCSEQMRCEEALEYYERALKIRRSSPNLPEQSLAIVHNNLANCYRRMRRFDEAHLNANLAISLFHEKDKGMSYAYGTRGQIYLDAGEYEKALEWLTKSNEERLRRSDSDQQVILENYENQIVALEALGRNAEAEIIRLNAEHVRKAIESVPLVDIETGATAKPAEDAVFIELTRASAIPPEDEKESRIELTAVLGAAALLAEVGHYCGKVSLPESTTLIFYGSNADDLFAILQPALEAEKNQFHARVSIQKDGVIREVLIQGEGVILQ